MIRNFKELKMWQKAHQLTIFVYKFTGKFPTEEKFGIISQVRRAAVSVVSNMVEGFRRNSFKVSENFYEIADGSLEELKYQMYLSKDLDYISEKEYNQFVQLSEEVSKMLHAWMRAQK